MSLYNFETARTEEQRQKMIDLDRRGICTFCPEYIYREDGDSVIREMGAWILKKNSFPYENTDVHLLVIPKRHIVTISEFTPEEFGELQEIIKKCEEDFSLDSYAFAMRSGDMSSNGGSIEHIHGHIIQGDKNSKEKVKFKVYEP